MDQYSRLKDNLPAPADFNAITVIKVVGEDRWVVSYNDMSKHALEQGDSKAVLRFLKYGMVQVNDTTYHFSREVRK